MQRGWLSQYYQPPSHREMADSSMPKPEPKAPPAHEIGPAMAGLRTDEQLRVFLEAGSSGTAVVEYGTSWCHKCHEMFPDFYRLSKKYPQHKYAVAQVEHMHRDVVSAVRYTPTFAIYRKGRKVDEVVGKMVQQLEDHLWLHTGD